MTSDLSRFEEKIHRVDLMVSVMVKRRGVVERDESSGMVVSDCLERSGFPLGIGGIEYTLSKALVHSCGQC